MAALSFTLVTRFGSTVVAATGGCGCADWAEEPVFAACLSLLEDPLLVEVCDDLEPLGEPCTSLSEGGGVRRAIEGEEGPASFLISQSRVFANE